MPDTERSEAKELPDNKLLERIQRWVQSGGQCDDIFLLPDLTAAYRAALAEVEASQREVDRLKQARMDSDGNLVSEIATLREQLAAVTSDRDHWKANHDEMVARNRILRDRPDLTTEQVAERLGVMDALVERANLREQLAAARASIAELEAEVRRLNIVLKIPCSHDLDLLVTDKEPMQ